MAGHLPVLLPETISALSLEDSHLVVDVTGGRGGHSAAILAAWPPGKRRLIVCDRDPEAVQALEERFEGEEAVRVVAAPFSQLAAVLAEEPAPDRILADLGVSSPQLDDAHRGFSFRQDGPLDMRMDPASDGPTAADLVNNLPEKALADLIYGLGDERRSRAIARVICQYREKTPFSRTAELAEVVARAIGRRGARHPATRTFLALRLEVNREMDELRSLLVEGFERLAPGGRMVIITFHSHEDRIVKRFAQEQKRAGRAEIIKPFPLAPSREEQRRNPRARSAKLRVFVRHQAEDSEAPRRRHPQATKDTL